MSGPGALPSRYYRWLDQPITDARLDDAYLANAIFDAHRDDPEFRYRFLADEVRHAGDHPEVTDRVVWRICCDNGWWSVFGKPKGSKRPRPGRRRLRTWCVGCSPRRRPTSCGSPTSPSTGPTKDNAAMERSSRCCSATCSTAVAAGSPATSRLEIATRIERTYHRRRRKAAVGRLTPIEYETIITPQATTAA